MANSRTGENWEAGHRMGMTSTLYIGNLPWTTTEQDLSAWVSAHAKVEGARIITDRETGRSRGFGFVEVAAEDAAKAVEALNGVELGGRAITVSEAKARQR
jgi:RNA recognition motif-containing protein